MLESYAMQTVVNKIAENAEIINFSNIGQRKLYSVFCENNTLKNIIKNILFPHRKRIIFNNSKYEDFKNKYMNLSRKFIMNL